jgi:hypothetical protein
MGFSVANLFTASIMFLNAAAILSERRFLAPLGLATVRQGSGGQGQDSSFYFDDAASPAGQGALSPAKEQLKHVLASVRTLLRMPLIILNSVMIVFLLIFG